MEGVHVERQVVQLATVIGDSAQGEAIETSKAVYEAPHLLVSSMKDVRSIAMNVNVLHTLTMHIAADMAAPIDDKTRFSVANIRFLLDNAKLFHRFNSLET